ncbi:phosphohistidine phosphatase SixA [Oscillatoria sp. CS-180]|uniref:phosphohistidine phosphatase SixA n=1 Tax=Oscillatoria sp. CS-180 TaxID=3021720 RepID=UPI002330D0E8|nr:phosphohistidine phosphatase SixA [Oscillatoria sp. CS-180]MDB9525677.1 phosphohistidine phosphatase SixA [Oscillatoria sp. CS-180]
MASSPQTDLYFIRHGIAAERGTYDNDDERPLTEKGRSRTKKVARRLKELNLEFDLVLTSPLIRASQTAEILLKTGLAPISETRLELAPGGSLQAWLPWLAQWQTCHSESRLALIGHEPDLTMWAQQLVIGQISDRWHLKKAGIVGVQVLAAEEAIANSMLFWFTPPRLML